MRPLPDQDYIQSRLDYDPETGIFRWKPVGPSSHKRWSSWNAQFAGKAAGGLCHDYVVICLDDIKYPAHKLAWKYVHGEELEVDHRDRNKTNNRLANLRKATRSQNMWNTPRFRGKSLPKGVHLIRGNQTYEARITIDGKLTYLGVYRTPIEAHDAYCRAAIAYRGEFACVD